MGRVTIFVGRVGSGRVESGKLDPRATLCIKSVEYSLVLDFLSFDTNILEHNMLRVLPARLPASPRQLRDGFHAVFDALSSW